MSGLASAINTQLLDFINVILQIALYSCLLAIAVGGIMMAFMGSVDQKYRQAGKEIIIWSIIGGAIVLAVGAAV